MDYNNTFGDPLGWILMQATPEIYNPWMGSIAGALLVGLCGIVPLLFIPLNDDTVSSLAANSPAGEKLKLLLSFAVGGLLADVFLHLLPEAWSQQEEKILSSVGNNYSSRRRLPLPLSPGLWVLTGLLAFIIIEKLFTKSKPSVLELDDVDVLPDKEDYDRALSGDNNNVHKKMDVAPDNSKEISGYLNLMANVIDNFTHGLAVGGSFLLSWRVGVLTTLAIVVHEVPHEVGDFAILMRAGFSRLGAAKAQLATATSSVLGAVIAIAFSSTSHEIEQKTCWILPFTAGGFLHIALVTVVPELMEETEPRESLKQLASLVFGVIVMGTLTALVEE